MSKNVPPSENLTVIDPLTPRQHRAILALLTTPAMAVAAEKAGVNPKTLTRWMALPTFTNELKRQQTGIIDQATVQPVGGLQTALNILVRLMLGAKSESVKLAAAREWLDVFMTIREQTEIERRLDALERNIKQ
jgi:phage terminase small subunit